MPLVRSIALGPLLATLVALSAAADTVHYRTDFGALADAHGEVVREDPWSIVLRLDDGDVLTIPTAQIIRVTPDAEAFLGLRTSAPIAPGPTETWDPDLRPRSGRTALLLSLLVPGAGQIYNGDVGNGLFALTTALTGVAFALSADPGSPNEGLGYSLYAAAALVSLADAPAGATRRNAQFDVRAGAIVRQGTPEVVLALEF